ncbi:hypothetical protein DFJ73DRAFT_905940 [Zopfochytrium polystomum]|nr:hypothetical protein DFJ73DRAFT_905940 [Zopfochytrium polystomum]
MAEGYRGLDDDAGREEPGLALKVGGDAVPQGTDDQGLYDNDRLQGVAGAADDAVAAGAEEASTREEGMTKVEAVSTIHALHLRASSSTSLLRDTPSLHDSHTAVAQACEVALAQLLAFDAKRNQLHGVHGFAQLSQPPQTFRCAGAGRSPPAPTNPSRSAVPQEVLHPIGGYILQPKKPHRFATPYATALVSHAWSFAFLPADLATGRIELSWGSGGVNSWLLACIAEACPLASELLVPWALVTTGRVNRPDGVDVGPSDRAALLRIVAGMENLQAFELVQTSCHLLDGEAEAEAELDVLRSADIPSQATARVLQGLRSLRLNGASWFWTPLLLSLERTDAEKTGASQRLERIGHYQLSRHGDKNGERRRPFRSRPLFPSPPTLRHADVTDVTTHHPSLTLALAACPCLELICAAAAAAAASKATPQPNTLLREETSEALLTRCPRLREDCDDGKVGDEWAERKGEEKKVDVVAAARTKRVAPAAEVKRLCKKSIIAKTGAGQHGVATATACAKFGLDCAIYMGAEECASGSKTLKDAINEASETRLGDVASVNTTQYLIRSAIGPNPFPTIAREFQSGGAGKLPDAVVACVGGGSNAIGMFHPFVGGVEVGVCDACYGATVLHGTRTNLLRDADGQIIKADNPASDPSTRSSRTWGEPSTGYGGDGRRRNEGSAAAV